MRRVAQQREAREVQALERAERQQRIGRIGHAGRQVHGGQQLAQAGFAAGGDRRDHHEVRLGSHAWRIRT